MYEIRFERRCRPCTISGLLIDLIFKPLHFSAQNITETFQEVRDIAGHCKSKTSFLDQSIFRIITK